MPVHVLPSVGRNLHDHIDVVLGYHIPGDPDLLGVSPTGGETPVEEPTDPATGTA